MGVRGIGLGHGGGLWRVRWAVLAGWAVGRPGGQLGHEAQRGGGAFLILFFCSNLFIILFLFSVLF